MLSIKYILENEEELISKLAVKNFDANEILDKIKSISSSKKDVKQNLEYCQAEMNLISKEIGMLYKTKQIVEANEAKKKSTELKEEIKNLSKEFNNIDKEFNNLIVQLPNIPNDLVPKGKGEKDNIEIRKGGTIPKLHKKALAHWDLAKKYDIIDFELGNKITGSGFPVYKGKGAKIQRSLISFFLDQAIENGYNEVIPPLMVNEASAFGTGQLPDKEGQMYTMTTDNLFLIPTAEVPVTNIYRDTILKADDLPIKTTAYTPCFRREAGSYGKDVRGLNRLHQFDKVEIVQIQKPENSYDTLNEMLEYIESLLIKLELPYRILTLCGGDLSFTSALTYDFEVYSAAQKKWLEVSSVSNFESFQANRLKLRYRSKDSKKTQLTHTLNGSALALPRILAAILENNQTEKGIKIPKVLQPYFIYDIIN